MSEVVCWVSPQNLEIEVMEGSDQMNWIEWSQPSTPESTLKVIWFEVLPPKLQYQTRKNILGDVGCPRSQFVVFEDLSPPSLDRTKHTYVKWLEYVGSIGWQTKDPNFSLA